jgi:probable phosphoglycerate mutase
MATAQVSAEALGLTVQVIPELAEVHHGEMAGLTTTQANARFPGALEQRARDKYTWQFPGGESYADADGRAAVALARIALAGARRPLIVSHEMISRMLLRNLLGTGPAEAITTQQPHHVLYRVEPSSGQLEELTTTTTTTTTTAR